MRSFALLAVGLLASTAVAQIQIPPHVSTYNGYSRGFNFTSTIPFTISGLDLPTDAFQPGDTAGYLVRVNGATALWSIGNVGPIAANIAIAPGDVVDIIGNWSPATTTNFSGHNSYSSGTAGAGAAPYASLIEGVPHTLMRTGWQYDIGNPAWVSTGTTGAYLAPTTGQLGRVIVYTTSNGTIATNTPIGAGCITVADVSFYELFATSAAFDLSNTAMSLLHTGAGYLATTGVVSYVPPTAAAQVLALTDDSQASVTLPIPMPVGSASSTTSLMVCSNGFVSAATGNGTAFGPTAAGLLNKPQVMWAVNWHDYNPAAAGGGQVKFEVVGAMAIITWDGVYDFGGTSAASANTFQVQFDMTTGSAHYVYQTMSTAGNARMVGFSDAGNSADPGSMDISAALPASFNAATFAINPLTLAATSRPVIGTAWGLNVTNVPASGTVGVDIFGFTDPNIPDLAFLGLPGCGLRASLDALSPWLVAGNSHAFSLALPNNPSLVNVHVYTSAAVFQPGVNAFGAILANGIDGKLGDV